MKEMKEMDLKVLRRVYTEGNHICIMSHKEESIYSIIKDVEFCTDAKYKLIHKNHEEVLNAWLLDNDVEIEWRDLGNNQGCFFQTCLGDFIEFYKEEREYRLKKDEAPLFTKEVEQTKKEEPTKFEDADFDYEILKEVNGMFIGYIKPDNFAFPTSWNKEGKQQQHSPQFDLTPIKKLYFPCLLEMTNKTDNHSFIEYCVDIEQYETICSMLYSIRVLSNEEIDNLKCKG